ncbi:MAG: glycosyltransferase [Candidatus Cloacimonetes bacterium]|nr:glycosyltransferase [Candidatus Cloacimonadota bacterium]
MPFYMLLFFIGFLFLIDYLFYLIIFAYGYKRRNEELIYKKKTVSIIIAARNEEKNIGRLLTSLVNQSYPEELYKVYVIDDRSEDKTAQIVQQFADKWNNVQLVQIKKTPVAVSPKKFALSEAIKESDGEIILLTDADCLVTKYWVEAMVSNFTDNISMVAGFSRTLIPNWRNSTLLEKFEYFDFLLMFMAAAGAIFAGKYFSCSNQNLAYLRTAYKKVGGFEKIKHILSGDDVNLMQLFRKERFKIRFSLINHSFVYTQPVSTFGKLISQRSRWASNAKWQLQLNPEFFVYLVSIFIVHVSIITLIFLCWQLAMLMFLFKAIVEFIYVASHFKLFESEKQRMSFFPYWAIIQPFYLIIVTLRGVLNLFSWKV